MLYDMKSLFLFDTE